MLGIKRVDHVSMAVWKIEDMLPLLTELFDMRVVDRYHNEVEGYNGVTLDIMTCQGRAAIQWEILEPNSDDSFLTRFLRERGPGLHHVTFEVEDVAQAAEALRKQGIEPHGGVRQSGGWKELFIHPRDTGGVLIQLYQYSGEHSHEP